MSEWIEERLDQLASIAIGGTPPRDVPIYWATDAEAGLPWVSISDLGPRYVRETKERITEIGLRSSNAKMIIRGTLLMSFKLTIERTGIADCDLFSNEAIAAIVPNERKTARRSSIINCLLLPGMLSPM